MKEEIMKKLGKFNDVENMTTPQGNKAPNQFILYFEHGTMFKSYESIICIILESDVLTDTLYYLGDDWDYSNTTKKYLYKFSGRDRAQIEKDLKHGVAVLVRGL